MCCLAPPLSAALLPTQNPTAASIDWLADRLPRLKSLRLRCDDGRLSKNAPLPPLRHLSVTGDLPGIQRAFAQLKSLSINMLLHENCVAGPIRSRLMKGIAGVRSGSASLVA